MIEDVETHTNKGKLFILKLHCFPVFSRAVRGEPGSMDTTQMKH